MIGAEAAAASLSQSPLLAGSNAASSEEPSRCYRSPPGPCASICPLRRELPAGTSLARVPAEPSPVPVPEMERESQVSSKWSWARHLASLGLCFHFISPKLTRTLTPLRSTATCPIGTPSPPDPAPCSCPRLHPHPPDNSNSLRSSLGDPSRTNHPGSRSSMALCGTQGDTSGPPEGFAGAGSLSRLAGRVPTSPQTPLRPSPGSLSPPEGGLS